MKKLICSIPKFKVMLAMCLFGQICLTSAQSDSSFKCYTLPGSAAPVPIPPDIIPPPDGDVGDTGPAFASCTPTSEIFHDFYKKKENYIPANGDTTALYMNKTIKVMIHVVNPELGYTGPKVNYADNPTDRALIAEIIEEASKMLKNVAVPALPKTAICGSCHVEDSRFRIEIVKDPSDPSRPFIKYHNMDLKFKNLYGGSTAGSGTYSGNLEDYLIDPEKVMNIFLLYHDEGYGVVGYALGSTSISSHMAAGYNAGIQYIAMGNVFQMPYPSRQTASEEILHEIGHHLGLEHTFDMTCDESLYDYAYDILGLDAYPGTKGTPCVPDTVTTFNVMDYGSWRWELTPTQIGRMHRNAHFLTCRKYIYNTWPEDKYHDHTGQGQLLPYEITQDETWDFDIKMYSDIVVKQGNKLTIKCRVLMPYHANIIVEPGAQLDVDGGIISSVNDTTMWYGIAVLGNLYESQEGISPNQGIVYVRNNGLIENALVGINLGDEINFDATKAGGIARIQDARFKNNRRSISWNAYHNLTWKLTASGWERTRLWPNRSYVLNSSFTVDEHMIRDPRAQVTLFDVDNINIKGCQFLHKMPYSYYTTKFSSFTEMSEAILSVGATLNVSDNTSAKPSTFKGFMTGIRSEVFGTAGYFKVSNSTFENNQNGITTSALNSFSIKNNNFLVNHPFSTTIVAKGIKMWSSNGFQVQSNHFEKSSLRDDIQKCMGVDVDNSGSVNNRIQNNSYANLKVGNLSTRLNTNKIFDLLNDNKSEGLEFLCNNYMSGIVQSEYVFGSSAEPGGIRRVQGSEADLAGNIFNGSGALWSQDIYMQDAASTSPKTQPIDKYYYSLLMTSEKPNKRSANVAIDGKPYNSNCTLPIEITIDPGGLGDTWPWTSAAAASATASLVAAYDDYSEDRNSKIDSALLAMNSPYADIERAILQLQSGQIAQGLARYDAIASTRVLTTEEQAEFALGASLIRLIAQHYQSGSLRWDSLSTVQIDSLRYLRDSAKMWVHERACNWLGFAYGEYCAKEQNDVPSYTGNNARRTDPNAADVPLEPTAFLSIAPNPSHRYFDIRYQLLGEANAELSIYDVLGRKVLNTPLPAMQRQYQLDAEHWTNGVYLYQVTQGEQTLYYGKLIKQ
ncbi:MAG: T9SS type A sorting domain-containing protein [Chitinophagaceae bacterium]|nr:T9SS type A sorting domain-containing protein [Chitinophagaceae bacterium]